MNSENIGDLIAALAKAQGEMSAAYKDSSNPFFNSKYADLSSVWNACREALSKHGLAVIQTMHEKESGEQYLKTTLAHSSGQWMSSVLPIKVRLPEEPEINPKTGKVKKVNELQALGSVLTYLRRYALAAIVGVAPDDSDDDGNTQMFTHPKEMKPNEAMQHLAEFGGDSIMILMFLQERCVTNKTTLRAEVETFLKEKVAALPVFEAWKKAAEAKKTSEIEKTPRL